MLFLTGFAQEQTGARGKAQENGAVRRNLSKNMDRIAWAVKKKLGAQLSTIQR